MPRHTHLYLCVVPAFVACSSPVEVESAPSGMGICNLPDDFNACDWWRESEPLPNLLEIPDVVFHGHTDNAPWPWRPDDLEKLPAYAVEVCIDAKGMVVAGETFGQYGLYAGHFPIKTGARLYSKKRFLLKVSTVVSALINYSDQYSTHVTASGPNALLARYFVHNTLLPGAYVPFTPPDPEWRVRMAMSAGYFVVLGNTVIDGWIAPDKKAFFVITPDEEIDFDFSTSTTGKPVEGLTHIIKDEAWKAGFSAGGPPP